MTDAYHGESVAARVVRHFQVKHVEDFVSHSWQTSPWKCLVSVDAGGSWFGWVLQEEGRTTQAVVNRTEPCLAPGFKF